MRNSSLLFAISILVATSLTGCTAEARKNRSAKRADRYFQAGEFEKAKIEYMNVLRADSRNGAAFKRVGLIWSEQGTPLRAVPFFLKAKELSPADDEVRTKLALSMISLGGHAEARKEALAILERTPGHEEALHILSDTSRTPEEIAEAEQQLAKAANRESATFHLASATLLLRKRDLVGAESALQRALVADPKSVLVHAALGMIHLLHQSKEKAEQEFKTAAELSPVRSTARLRYAEFKAEHGAPEEARETLREIISEAGDYLPARILQAQMELKEKKYDEALKILDGALRQDPESLEGRMLQSQVWLAQGEAKKAAGGLERLANAFPTFPFIRYQLARAYLQESDPAQAIVALDQAITANPEYTEAILLRAELNLRQGDAQPAVMAMTGLLAKQPGLVQGQVLLAEAYRASGRFEDAAAILRALIEAAPKNTRFHIMLGVLLQQQKKIVEARDSFAKALELAPDNLSILPQLVDLDLIEKNISAAAERVQAQMLKTPQAAAVHFLQGKICAAQQKWDDAEAALEKALELDPNFSPAYNLLISTYLAANKLSQAVARLEGLIEKNPKNDRALMVLALIQEKLNDFPKAAASYHKLLSLKPDFSLALNNLAYIYLEHLKKTDEAFEFAKRARAADPNSPNVADTLGWALHRRGEYQQALALLQESAGKLSENLEVQYHLGMAAYMAGQTEIARTALQKVANAPAGAPWKKEAQQRLVMLNRAPGFAVGSSVKELEAALKERGKDPLLLEQLGAAYSRAGQHEEAAKAFESALNVNPGLVSALIELAELYSGPLKDPRKALEFARNARNLSPADPKIGAVLGRVAFRSGNHSWAHDLLQVSAARLEGDPQVQYDFGLAAYSVGRVEEARQVMERVKIATPPPDIAAEAETFLVLTAPRDVRNTKSLAAAAKRKLQNVPNDVPALMVQAMDQEEGDRIAATTTYERVLQIYPGFAPAQKRLAALYAEDPSRITQAYELAIRARKGLPEDVDVLLLLAELRYARKEYAATIQLLEESARKKTLVSRSLYYLGMSYIYEKQAEQGRKMLGQALASGLQEPLSGMARNALAEPAVANLQDN